VTIKASAAAQTWQQGIYKKINHKMKLRSEEFYQEIGYLKGVVEGLQNFRKQLLTEKHD